MEVGVVIEWIVFFVCLILFLTMSVYLVRGLRVARPTEAGTKLTALMLKLLEWPHHVITLIAGNRGWKYRGFVCIALMYWVAMPTIAILFRPDETVSVQVTTFGLVIALHLWLWPNILGDYIGLRVTRKIIWQLIIHVRNCQRLGTRISIATLWWGIGRDFLIAGVTAFAVVLTTNLANLFQHHQEFQAVLVNVGHLVSWDNTMGTYSSVVKGIPQAERFPGHFLIAISTFLPTFFWLGALLLVSFMELVSRFAKVTVMDSDKAYFLGAGSLWLASLLGLIQLAVLLGLLQGAG